MTNLTGNLDIDVRGDRFGDFDRLVLANAQIDWASTQQTQEALAVNKARNDAHASHFIHNAKHYKYNAIR